MRVLVLFAHPVETSFGAALHRCVVETLTKNGHTVDDCDLYAEGFDPVLSREERIGYHSLDTNRAPVASHVERLLAAEALVIVSPVWNFGLPAILKGYMDRVFLPGVTFVMREGRVARGPLRLRHFTAIHTYGGTRRVAWWVGDPPRRVMTRVVGRLLAPGARRRYCALYDMNNATDAKRAGFLVRVRREMEAL